MDGFKKNPKIACFKEGGQVGYKSRKTADCDKADMKQDKAIVKKAVGQHEAVKHKGEGKTELKLKSGGRCKKEAGTVKKYKTGGEVGLKGNQQKIDKNHNGKVDAEDFKLLHKKDGGKISKCKDGGEVIGMKKTATDKKDIAGIKKKGSAPKKAAPKTKQAPTKSMGMAAPEMPMEGEMPAFQYGGSTSDIDRKMMESERQRKMARTKNAMDANLTPSQMSQFAGQEMAPMAPMPTTSGAGAVTDEERALLRGISAVGRACGGSI